MAPAAGGVTRPTPPCSGASTPVFRRGRASGAPGQNGGASPQNRGGRRPQPRVVAPRGCWRRLVHAEASPPRDSRRRPRILRRRPPKFEASPPASPRACLRHATWPTLSRASSPSRRRRPAGAPCLRVSFCAASVSNPQARATSDGLTSASEPRGARVTSSSRRSRSRAAPITSTRPPKPKGRRWSTR